MRLLVVAGKTAREQVRSPLVALLSISFGAFFVLLVGLFFPSGGSTTYPVAIANADAGPHGASVVSALREFRYGNGGGLLEVHEVADAASARDLVAGRGAVVFVDLPADFSANVEAASGGSASVPLTFGGDLGSPAYSIAAIMVATPIDAYLQQATGRPSVTVWDEVALGGTGGRSEFDLYVSGVLVFAIGLIIFSAAMVLAQEVETGTVQRLIRTRVGAVSLLGGITLVEVVLGLLSGAAALSTAVLLGFHSAGPLWLALPVWTLTSLAVIGLGLLVAAFARTVAQAFLLANLPFGVFMFLSGTMFPVRGVDLFSVAGHTVNLLDLLPPRHAVNALSTVFGYGSDDIGYELVMLTVLSVGYFALGAWAFRQRHLRVAR
jgi:ABC-2 type transport system permease protein